MDCIGWGLGMLILLMIVSGKLRRSMPSIVDVVAWASCIAFVVISTTFVATILGTVAGVVALVWLMSTSA